MYLQSEPTASRYEGRKLLQVPGRLTGMREASRTTRERMADRLRESALPASALAREFDIRTADALAHLEHIARSTADRDEQFLVAPPECIECGFDGFDDLVNRPSRCPECKSETVEEPVFRID